MADQSLDALAEALAADPPRTVDLDAVAAANRDELAAALRRAVADLPAAEQRTRLAGAFRVISAPTSNLAAIPQPTSPSTGRRRNLMDWRLSPLRYVTPARAGLLAGLLVVFLLAGLLWSRRRALS